MRRIALPLIKLIHSAIFFVVEACVMIVLWDGIRRKRTRRTALAAGVVTTEIAVFLSNGARCPLTAVARNLGADSGSVTDIYLPKNLAHALPVIHAPLVAWALWLHRDAFRRAK
ncbi:MAG: hypothetical protein OEX04_00815 [Acidimicrobiia bacterium]|nr:hypothetical protein [Acidimicrobiia bacterium]MDH4305996.1 hypothetical protein [Acidimicrobiia bacterium]MDH5292883.1 hypothetical protein [Acidimicrobiia bacterium]